MQDEVIKHTKKAIEKMKDKEHSFWDKLKEVSIEILIIVFAVTLSIWLHTWSEQQKQRNEAKEFLSDLKEDLNNDIDSLKNDQIQLNKNRKSIANVLMMTDSKLDSIIKNKSSFGFQSAIGTTKISDGDYEGFKSSGKIGFIENKQLKKYILNYYQDAIPDLIEAQKINDSMIIKISDYWADHADEDIKQIILSQRLKYRISMYLNTSEGTLELYHNAIKTAQKIITEINKQKD